MDDSLPAGPPERLFAADRPKACRAKCKRCKEPCASGQLRLAKLVPNQFSTSGGWAKQWHHPQCLWDAFSRQRPSTKKIEDPAKDIEGWEDLIQEDMDTIVQYLRSTGLTVASPKATRTADDDPGARATPKRKKATPKQKDADVDPAGKRSKAETASTSSSTSTASVAVKPPEPHKDDYFRSFRALCVSVANEPSYLAKTALVAKMFTEGSTGDGFKGDLEVWVRLLLPMVEKRVYNLQSKQLVKLFSRMFGTSEEEMLEHLEQGDVSETVQCFFEQSTKLQPCSKSTILLADVNDFLERLSAMTREEEQTHLFKKLAKRCTGNDLRMVIRLVKHDLRINAGPKHILEALHPDAYAAYQSSRNLLQVVRNVLGLRAGGSTAASGLNIGVAAMTPVLPMLAEACKSVEQAMKKCPHGMYAEIKYDGERVQVHKQGDEFKYFSRSLKPVMAHKVNHFKDFIPKAFPSGDDLILDSEVLLIDTGTGKPLPFGSLGVHKQSAFKDANVCLFVFDCLYYNGESLTHKPMRERRKILKKVMVEIPNRILFSELEEVHRPADLCAMMEKVFRLGLEGLVLKDLEGQYEPGKRHWLKVKKDYLFGGAMADTADLVVLGAWYGTGQKGGMMSIFLMGCFDPSIGRWCTVTKVHGGHDDATLERLQTELKMVKISKDPSKIPAWLKANKQMFPDFVSQDPKVSPVWEVTGAEFTQNEVHTADGISVRFPRVTRIRDDKTWQQATSLPELRELYKKSKETSSFSLSGVSGYSSQSGSPSKGSPERRRRDASDSDYSSDGSTPATPRKKTKVLRRSDSPPVKRKLGPSKPLPDVFQGVQLRLPDGLSESEASHLKRYFVAYGGSLLPRHARDKPSHVLHCGVAEVPAKLRHQDAVHVDLQWLWNSIKQQRLLDTAGYSL